MSERRQSVLDAVLARYPHDDPDSLPASLSRYLIVSQHRDSFGDGSGYWYEGEDDADQALRAIDDVDEHGYAPFLVVDLDTGCSYQVKSSYALGVLSDDEGHDFTRLALLDVEVDRSPRARASSLAERPA